MNANMIDIIALALVAFFMYKGMNKGLVAEVFKILGVIIGFMLAIQNIQTGSAIVRSFISTNDQVEKVLGFILIFIIVMGVTMLLANFVNSFLNLVLLGWIDKTGGVLFGGLKGALIISSILSVLAFLPDSVASVKDLRYDSLAYTHLRGFAPKVYDFIFKIVPGSDSFAGKLKEVFPMVGSLPGFGEGSSPISGNPMNQLMGKDNKGLLEEFKDATGSDFNNLSEEELKKIVEKYQAGSQNK